MWLPEDLEDTPLKKTMKMTWLHMEFVLIFSPTDDRTLWQLCQPKRLLTLAGMNADETKTALSEKILLQRTLIQLRVRRHLIVAVTYFNRTPHLI